MDVYEYRAGRLIRGVTLPRERQRTDRASGGSFVPEIGSRVEAAPLPGLRDRVVYNNRRFSYWTAERKKQFPDGVPAVPAPPAAGTPAGYDWKPVSALDQQKRAYDVRVVGGVAEVGFLRDDGEFIPDYERAPFAWEGVSDAPFDLAARGKPRLFTLPHPAGEAKSEDVYEFRTGRLVKGTLRDTGTFVPETGSVVADFASFDPAKDSRRVYNLPGTLTRK